MILAAVFIFFSMLVDRYIFVCIIISCLMALNSCTNVTVKSSLAKSSFIAKGERVIFLNGLDNGDAEIDSCISDRVRKQLPEITVLSSQEFRAKFSPQFYAIPNEKEKIKRLFEQPETRKQLDNLKLRFVVFLKKYTPGFFEDFKGTLGVIYSQKGGWSHGFILCAQGCMGLMAFHRSTQIKAIVWDVKDYVELGVIEVDTDGLNIAPAFLLPVPIPLSAPESSACSEMAKQLAKLLLGNK